MNRWVEITFDCLPMRSIGRLDVPMDASPKFRALGERIKAALDKHGSFNTYYLYQARCVFHVVNRPDRGMIDFAFEGTVFTDSTDCRTERADLQVQLVKETCDWLREPVVRWFEETVTHAVCVEFDRFIEAGDLERAKRRLEELRSQADASGGYLGMYL
ncbi:MAG: hypothetical protein AB7F89_19370 [Pirellulaceae bacterium]